MLLLTLAFIGLLVAFVQTVRLRGATQMLDSLTPVYSANPTPLDTVLADAMGRPYPYFPDVSLSTKVNPKSALAYALQGVAVVMLMLNQIAETAEADFSNILDPASDDAIQRSITALAALNYAVSQAEDTLDRHAMSCRPNLVAKWKADYPMYAAAAAMSEALGSTVAASPMPEPPDLAAGAAQQPTPSAIPEQQIVVQGMPPISQ